MKKSLRFLPLILIGAFGLSACNFDFLKISVQEITLSETELILAPQQTYQLTADIYPASATNKQIEWSSSDSCASIVDGLITAESEGNAVITAAATDGSGITATCDLTIQQIDVTGITLSPTSLELYVGQQSTITDTVLPTNASNKNVTWASTDESIVTVNNGNVEGQGVGDATITATTQEGSFSATCAIAVTEAPDVTKTSMDSNYSDYVTHNAFNIDGCPTTGTGKLLVIPIWFTNSNTYITSLTKKANVLSDIQAAYFGTTSQTGWNSVETFYDTESKSALSLEGTVSDWYECGQSSTSYYSDSTGGDNTISLVKTASDWYFANHTSESRTDYDRDGNGYLDGVMLIYGAPDYRELGNDSAPNLWAYCYWIQNGEFNSSTNPGPNVFFWASYDFMYSATTALLRAGSSYG
ncbi:MAG: Ig-like domain-containing protein, partial [Bacilli bacterium]